MQNHRFHARRQVLKPRRDGLVRLKAHSNSRVKVPDLADTEGPVIESNCAGAITPGGEQLEMNEQSVTKSPCIGNKVNSIQSAELASRPGNGEAQNKIALPAQREWNAAGGGPQMIGDGMFGSSSDVNQGTTADGERTGRGQSPHSSQEAGNDRGAKEGRDVVLGHRGIPSHKGPCSAERLCARTQGHNPPGIRWQPKSEPPVIQVSGASAYAAGATLLKALSRVPEPVHQQPPRTGKPDAGKPPVRFGWGATEESVLYPHFIAPNALQTILFVFQRRGLGWTRCARKNYAAPRRVRRVRSRAAEKQKELTGFRACYSYKQATPPGFSRTPGSAALVHVPKRSG
jgi:hypothetical protein